MKRRNAATTASSGNNANDAVVKTKRPRGRPRKNPRPAVSFYAVKSCKTIEIEEPIIFFGLKDLNLYAKYLQSQSSSSDDSVIVAYEEFDNLAAAMEYVQSTTPPKKKQRKKPTKKQADNNKNKTLETQERQGEETVKVATNQPTATSGTTASEGTSDTKQNPNTSAVLTTTTADGEQGNATTKTTTTKDNVAITNRRRGRPPGSRDAWGENFQLLVEYKQEHGNFKIPSKKEAIANPKYHVLIAWARKQRKFFSDFCPPNHDTNLSLTEALMVERRQRLQDIGFEIWFKPNKTMTQEAYNSRFQKRLQEIKEFKEKHGHVNITSINDRRLYQWLFAQKKAYHAATNVTQQQQNLSTSSSSDDTPNNNNNRGCLLTLEHIGALKELGISMEMHHQTIPTRDAVQEYVTFVKTHQRFPDYRSTDDTESRLARTSIKWKRDNDPEDGNDNPRLHQDLIVALNSVNFNWTKKKVKSRAGAASGGRKQPKSNSTNKNNNGVINGSTPWEIKFQALKTYIDKYGMEPTCRHHTLGQFVKHIRKEYNYMVQGKRSQLTLERFQKLTAAGFRFNVKRQRRYGFEGSDGGESNSDDDDEKEEKNPVVRAVERHHRQEQQTQQGAAAAAAAAYFGANVIHNDLWAAYR